MHADAAAEMPVVLSLLRGSVDVASSAGTRTVAAADLFVGPLETGGDGATVVGYEADAVVGGMFGGVGQRMLISVSRRMAGEFFGNVDAVLTGTDARPEVEVSARASGEGQVFTAPVAAGSAPLSPDFLKGIAVGAGLVLLGVGAGVVLGGRRG